MSRSYPSSLALLGLAAVAGYANRKKIGRYLSGLKAEAERAQLTGEDSTLGRLAETVRDTIRSDYAAQKPAPATGKVPPAPTGAG